MKEDFLGNIGGLNFVTGSEAFAEAADAQRKGVFGKPTPQGIAPPSVVSTDWLEERGEIEAKLENAILQLENEMPRIALESVESARWALKKLIKEMGRSSNPAICREGRL